MKHITSLVLLVASATAPAQLLLNPSFENGFGGDLSYWQHQCIAQSAAEGAPNSGSWCAEVEASNPQGCFGAYLYQVVPGAYPGMPFHLGGWCRNTLGPWAPTIGYDLGILDQQGNLLPLELGLTTTDTTWTWLATEDTLQMGPEDQAVVICNSGFVGGPAFALSRFDGIEFFENIPFTIPEAPALHSYWDLADASFTISCSDAPITRVRLWDPSGREVPAPLPLTNAHTVRIPLGALPPGLYLATVYTGQGAGAVRFMAGR